MSQMIADFLLRILGEEPAAYPHANDKWPAILAVLIDLSIPIVLVLLFLFPFIGMKIRKKKFTPLSIAICLGVGGMLAYGGWWLNEWSYGYGQGVIFNEIYGD